MIRVFITPNVILLLGDYVIRSSRNTNGTISAIILKVECGGTFRNRIFEEHRNYIINIPRLPIAISTNSSEEHFGIKFSLIVNNKCRARKFLSGALFANSCCYRRHQLSLRSEIDIRYLNDDLVVDGCISKVAGMKEER